MALHSCLSCRRPVRTNETVCPFCQAAVIPVEGPLAVASRLAIGGAIAVATAGCTVMVAQPVYGAPASPPSAKPSPTPTPPTAQPVYGAPAPIQTPTGQKPIPAPVYGAPVVPQPSAEPSPTQPPVAPVYGAPAPPRNQ